MMIDINKYEIEYKAAAVFGILSFLLSLILGLFAGNPAGGIFFKTLILTVVFAAVGYISLFVVKKYVPEMYEVLNNGIKRRSDDFQEVSGEEKLSGDIPQERETSADNTGTVDAGIDTIEEETSPAGNLKDDETASEMHEIAQEPVSRSAESEQEKIFRYQPEIAAQAIRTMMKRDDK